MNTKFLFASALFALCLLTSCEKALVNEDKTGKDESNLKVSVFEIEKTPFTVLTRGEAVSSVCTCLNFAVYAPDGTRVRQVNQTSEAANFGTAAFQLDKGDYLLVVVGHSSGGNPTMTDPTCIKFTNAQGFSDTFLYCSNITIGEEVVDRQVSLDRIVSLCRFVITDDYPAGIAKIRFHYTGGSGAFDATTGLGCINSKQDIRFDVTSRQKQFDLYTFLHDTEGTIQLTVTAYDVNENILNEREFSVPMEQNHITWMSGAFFSGSGVSSTTIAGVTVNTDWAGETHISF